MSKRYQIKLMNGLNNFQIFDNLNKKFINPALPIKSLCVLLNNFDENMKNIEDIEIIKEFKKRGRPKKNKMIII